MLKEETKCVKTSMLKYAMLHALDSEKRETIHLIDNKDELKENEFMESLLDTFEDMLSLCEVNFTYKDMDSISFNYKLYYSNPVYCFKDYIKNSNSRFREGLGKRGFVSISLYETIKDEPEKFELIVRVSYEKLGLQKPTSVHETDNEFAKMRDRIENPIIEIELSL